MADIYDISSIPARFAAEVTRGAELQNRRAAMSTLPEEMPDYARMLGAEYVPPSDTAYVLRRMEEIVREEALCGPWGRV